MSTSMPGEYELQGQRTDQFQQRRVPRPLASATIKHILYADAAVGFRPLPACYKLDQRPLLHDPPNAHAQHDTQANLVPLTPGRRSLHIQKHTCSSCGYPAAKIRQCTYALIFPVPATATHPTQNPLQRTLPRTPYPEFTPN